MQSNTQVLQEKWKPVLDHEALPKIQDPYRRAVTAILLENQETAIRETHAVENSTSGLLAEASPTTAAGTGGFAGAGGTGVAGYDPVLISLVRRAAPQLIAYDICGVQPMSGPSGLIFYMRSNYVDNAAPPAKVTAANRLEAGFDEAATGQSAGNSGSTVGGVDDTNIAETDPFAADYYTADTIKGMATGSAEALGGGADDNFREMSFSIDRTTVTAVSRALKAEYTTELAQDLKAVHGLDAETELANILSTEILAEINREIVRRVNDAATAGAAIGTTTAGVFDLDTDSNGRWSVEKFKGLHFQIEREANAIAVATRRGRGNIIIASADVVAALSMTGSLDTGGSTSGGSLSDDGITGNTFVGTLNGKYKVYVDPYFAAAANDREYVTIGYKGSSPYDAGIFYCPYVPLQMVKATGEQTFQPKIGFKTRYGLTPNPFANATAANGLNTGANAYYRKVDVRNIM